MIKVRRLPVFVSTLVAVSALSLQALPPALAHGMPEMLTEKQFTIEVSRNGFRVLDGPIHQMKGETHLAINQGDQVTITFIYADTDYEKNNPHRIAIGRMRVDSGILDAENPRRTVNFIARRDGEALFRCVKLCEGHKRLQDGRLMVQAVAGAVAAEPTTLAVDIPREMVRGRETALAAVLTDAAGNPVQDASISFLVKSDFFVQDWMEVGEATTDSSGVAVTRYTPAQTDDFQLQASFPGDSAYQASEVSFNIRLVGAPRLYEPDVGLDVPKLGPKGVAFGGAPGFRVPPVAGIALSVLVLGIWSIYLFVVSQVYRISRES